MAEFDVKRVTTLEWAGIGAGLFAFVVSFFPWASLDVEDGLGLGTSFGLDVSVSAWAGGQFLAWFSVLMLVGAAVVILLPHFGTQVPQRSMIWMILSGLSFLFILLRWVTYDSFISANVGLFLGLAAALVSGVASFLAFRSAPKPGAAPQTGTAYGA